jgi:hypothetical protein
LQHTDYWQTLSNDTTLADYARLLHKWAHAVIVSIDEHESGYTFPLTEEDKANIDALATILKSGSDKGGVQAFHNFIKPILYARNSAELDDDEYSKWDDIFERLLALNALRDDGNFKPPKDVTGTFATLFYQIRGTILYEGLSNKANFGGNAYK